ncbi:MAG: sn-glycerol-3-phosphate ABC transporter permease UgpE [Proteobacteria bacterium]|nr:sn-glycerol-3-phosphate ABC transporter permease UgpE [Pseudomonadota bacterium]
MVGETRLSQILRHAVLLLGAVLVLGPIWLAFVASTQDPTDILRKSLPLLPRPSGLATYGEIFTSGMSRSGTPPLWRMLANSTIMALAIAIGKIIISLLSAYAIVFFRFPGRMAAFWVIFLTLMLPVEVRIVPTFEVVANLGLVNTYWGLTVPLMASATATFLFRQFFLTVPREIADAARLDGAGPWAFLWHILIPMSKTSIAALFVILFVYGWNQYLWPLLVTTEPAYYTVVMGIQRMIAVPDSVPAWHIIMATATLAMLPPAVVVILMRRAFVRGLVDAEK